MKRLSNQQTFFTKYIVTAAWLFGLISLPISNYNNFGQFELVLIIPFLLLALISYLPMKISYDERKLVVSDWRKDFEYKFEDVKSLEYSRRLISLHPYKRLLITTNDNILHKIYFMPRFSDMSLFSSELVGRQEELLELWSKRTTANKKFMPAAG